MTDHTPPLDAQQQAFKRMFEAACVDLALISESLGLDPDDGGAEPILAAIAELKAVIAQSVPVAAAEAADMFWNHDDAERSYDSIDELLNDEICNGALEVGTELTVQRAISLPNIKIIVTAIDANECDAQYEVIADEPIKGGAA